ncbi:DUF58 domain-containing protein [Amphibacillus sp. Q70]|uniref:DUF58 domain-containing protein n=1 Tax=Amphibacillus sp. Q70 TaxID=3453416 RepID=UPI003F8378B6
MRQAAYLFVKMILLFSLLIILFSYAMFQGGFVSWFLFYTALPFLIYYLIFILYPVKDWRVKRIVAIKPIKAGQTIYIRLELKRRMPIPFSYLIIEEFLPTSIRPYFVVDRWSEWLVKKKLPQREGTVKKMLFPLFRRKIDYQYQLHDLPRGVHSFQQISLTMTDVFGFITKSVVLPLESTLRVAPADLDLQLRWDNNEKQSGEEATSTFQTDRSNHITGARQYVPGDRLSAIHWKATAKTATLMTKEFEQEYSRNGTIMLLGMQSGVAYEWNLALCQAVLQEFIRRKLQVDFLHVGYERFLFSTEKEQVHLTDAFISFQPGANEHIIASTLDHYQRTVDKGNFFLLFTDQLTSGLVEQLIKLSYQRNKITIYVTRSQAEQTKRDQALENQLRSYRINVNLITEKELKHRRGVVVV